MPVFFWGEDTINLLQRTGGALKDAVVQIFGLQVVFCPRTEEVKKAAIIDSLKNAIGVGEMVLGRDIMDAAEFMAGLDQATEGILRALKAANLWRTHLGMGA